ncbi:hypothetical protein [Pelagibaculum spongiae]|uniref:FCP1 homology domain-containing protein n=1 Tax=Pelagibaculum spongiae TaxID=2080658 RepID=A0A2V1GX57_9GAMM|nr:hypothetical protein [Pelagibaculum spongiae]PVZ70600.1 hypothetical protein DC094_08455 [Pelagibaculum spongiae]
MKFIFFDLDETLIVTESRLHMLSEFQKKRSTQQTTIKIAKKNFYILYYQLHHMVFQHFYCNQKDFKVFIMSKSKYKKPKIREKINLSFDTELFTSDFKYMQSEATETFETVPWVDLDYLGNIRKEAKIQSIIEFLYNKKLTDVDCFLVDNHPKHLKRAHKLNITVIDSSAPDYQPSLTELVFGETKSFTKDEW